MQSSSRVIYSDRVSKNGKEHVVSIDETRVNGILEDEKADSVEEYNQYENIGASIIKNAKIEAEAIRKRAIDDSRALEEKAYKDAYEKAYNEGLEKGNQKGYEDAYNETVQKGKIEAENLKSLAKQNASNIVKSAVYEANKYFESKEEEIKKLSLEIASHILKERVKDNDGINNMVLEAIKLSKNTKSIIIKCSEVHIEAIREASEKWKRELPYNGDIFVIADTDLDEGTAVVEKDNGKVVVSIDEAFTKIKQILFKKE